MFFYSEKNINFLSHWGSFGEIKYDLETEEWIELSSTFLNEKTYLPLLKLLAEIKKQNFKRILQRGHAQFIRSPPIVRKVKIEKLHFFLLFWIEKKASQLFCMGNIENINQAIDIYETYNKNIPLEWPICTSTDILRTLLKLKTNLEKFEKYLLSTFYLLINFFSR